MNEHALVPRRSWLRRAAIVVATLALTMRPCPAWAGTYLDCAGILLKQARNEADYLERRLDSRELAALVHHLASARLDAARDMMVPKEVTQAHPHLLLMLEDYERAADAAASGGRERFIVFQRRARDEEEMFRSIMRQLGFPIEDEKKK